TFMDAFIGVVPGSMGETSAAAALFGLVVLLVTRVGAWETMLGVTVGTIGTVLLLNGAALFRGPLADAARICAGSGARMFSDTFVPRLERGAGIAPIDPLPYFGEQAEAVLEGTRHLILVGTRPPVTFFAYPGKPSLLVPEGCDVASLCDARGDGGAAMALLADALGASETSPVAELALPDAPTGDLDAAKIGAAIARHLPEGALVSDDGVS
ncbi:MAG: RnfABCDGE type electron transport complex subunit D, partial [Pseudomonadota bacterium]